MISVKCWEGFTFYLLNLIQSASNKYFYRSISTSETSCANNYPSHFGKWLAGLIDGDGSLLVSKRGYTSLEITIGLRDLPRLLYIQSILGGSVKLRSGSNAYRYRLMNRASMVKLIRLINGHIRHTNRLAQLRRVCNQLGITMLEPSSPNIFINIISAWFAGFFDADGTITFSIKNGVPQLSIRVANKLLVDVNIFILIFGGNIYFDASGHGIYVWSVQSRRDVLRVCEYFKKYCRSHKSKRFYLVDEYFRLRDLKAYKPNSDYYKEWLAFKENWG